jgi:hypothetical protein
MKSSIELGNGTRGREVSYFPSWLHPLISVRWKYRLGLAIDTNFRMKNKDRSAKDICPLGDGWGHFVPEKEYMEHIWKWGHKEHVSLTCSNIFWLRH